MAYESGFITSLALKLEPGVNTITLKTAPTITEGRVFIQSGSQKERIKFTGRNGAVLTGCTRQLSTVLDPAVSMGTGYNRIAGTPIKIVAMHDQFGDKNGNETYAGAKTFANDATFQKAMNIPVFADAAARDLAIPTPVDGCMCYLEDIEDYCYRINALWRTGFSGSGADWALTRGTTVAAALNGELFRNTADSQNLWYKDNSGNALAMPIKEYVSTSSGSADAGKVALLDPAGKLDEFVSSSSALSNEDYLVGEDLIQGDSLFVENNNIIAGSSTNIYNIGDNINNTKIAVFQVGSGISANTLKLALAKVGSPSVNLSIRIETDNAGDPSGTLVDANATATVLASGLTTSLVDTTVTLAGSITITRGTKVWIVINQVSGTVNSTNYFKLGYIAEHTTIFNNKYYNGSSWILGSILATPVNNGTNLSADANDTGTGYFGYRITITTSCYITAVTKEASCDSTVCYIQDNSGTTLASASFAGNVATFSNLVFLVAGTNYRVTTDKGGASGNHRRENTPGFPLVKTYFNYTGGIYESIDNSNWGMDLISVSVYPAISNHKTYILSSLFESSLLSKTDAKYTYKLPNIVRIATDNYSVGELVKYDFKGITKSVIQQLVINTNYQSTTYNSVDTGTNSLGYRILTTANQYIYSITKSSSSTATMAYIKSDAGTILASAVFVGQVATFDTPYYLINATYYRLECNNSGASYSFHTKSGTTFNAATTLNYIAGSNNGGSSNGPSGQTMSTYGFNITDIGTYTPSSLITKGSEYYISNLPGALSTSAGTNSKKVGKALDTTELYLYDLLSPNL